MQSLTGRVKKEAERLGARIVGIGTPDRWVNAPKGHRPQDFLPGATAVVSFGVPLFKGMTQWRGFMKGSEAFPEQKTGDRPPRLDAAWQIYGRMHYDAVNLALMSIAYNLGCFLNDNGHDVVTPGVTEGSGWARVKGMGYFHQWSQRHAAVAAGLGELGLNNMFISPEYGIRVRLGSLITNAPLTPDRLDKIGQICTGCRECVDACTDPETFGDQRTQVLVPGYTLTYCAFDKKKCGGDRCSRCIAVCPVGK